MILPEIAQGVVDVLQVVAERMDSAGEDAVVGIARLLVGAERELRQLAHGGGLGGEHRLGDVFATGHDVQVEVVRGHALLGDGIGEILRRLFRMRATALCGYGPAVATQGHEVVEVDQGIAEDVPSADAAHGETAEGTVTARLAQVVGSGALGVGAVGALYGWHQAVNQFAWELAHGFGRVADAGVAVVGQVEADGDDVPQWLRDGDYDFEYHLDAAALLQMCSPYASIAAISRVSGINQHQLSHYANGLKKPRPEQRRRIVEGLHKIGRELIAVE